MYRKLDPRWASTILGFVALAMVPIPFAFKKYVHTELSHQPSSVLTNETIQVWTLDTIKVALRTTSSFITKMIKGTLNSTLDYLEANLFHVLC